MKRRAAVLANDPVAEEAAQDFMTPSGSAVGAVLAGFFAAAGAYAGVLLGPVSVLVGGVGQGVRAFDGRLRQPGLGIKRPRGFTAAEPIPDAARVGVPCGVAAALVAHAYDAGQSLGSVLRAGVQRAERSGAPARARLLQRIRAVGAAALAEVSFTRALLRVAGPSEGGLITPSDFAALPEVDVPALERPGWGGILAEPPWARDLAGLGEHPGLGIGYCVCAVDARGVLATLCYRRVDAGLGIGELELEAPLSAVPVRRGVARFAPGKPLPAPAPIGLRREGAHDPITEALACPPALYLADDSAGCLRLRRDPATLVVDVLRGGP
jgi:gamma-glutamyltranspeptidase/glutathione hydrolase